jgi:hypothetical protein
MFMDWLQRLHLIDAPAGTSLRSAELSLRGLLPWWAAALVLLASAAGVYFLYARESARLGRGRRLLLVALRLALIALVLALLQRPVLQAEFAGERARGVVLLIDNSQSMTQQDRRVSDADRLRAAIARGLVPPGTSVKDSGLLGQLPADSLADPARAELVRAALANGQMRLLPALEGRGPLTVFLFDRHLLSPAEGEAGRAVQELKADGAQTALADAVNEVLVRAGPEPPAALVVVTDGRDNASKLTLDEAARACRDRGVPLHVWGVGSAEAGVLEFKDVLVPRTVFVDEKPDVKDDPLEVPVRFRCRGFKQGTVVLTLSLGGRVVREEFPVREGEDIARTLRLVPEKGTEGEREARVKLELKGERVSDEVVRPVQVKTNRVKVLYVEDTPRREYKFIQPVLDRDRRVLARFHLVEGDPQLAESGADPESGSLYLDKFPDNFPDPAPRDPDRRPYDLLILGDVPAKSLGEGGVKAVRQFVKEGGGLVVIAGRGHCPAEYANTPLAEVLPVEFSRQEFPAPAGTRTQAFKPALTYDGEQSGMLALADRQDENLRLWREELWKNNPGFFWHYPVSDLRPGATALLVHPEQKAGRKPNERPMPLVASHFYGKGEVLFLGIDETWRWRDGTGDRLTARFWGQVVSRLGLPHLLGNAARTQIDLERGQAVLGRPGSVKARLLDGKYEPLTRPEVRA